jgi:hypothetical protein
MTGFTAGIFTAVLGAEFFVVEKYSTEKRWHTNTRQTIANPVEIFLIVIERLLG